jgi:hypothetical protein
VVVTGLFDDETEGPEDYAEAIAEWRARGLTALCANPDVIVDRGDKRIYCAGAIAEAYAAAGGDVVVSGKPHDPIYGSRRSGSRRSAAAGACWRSATAWPPTSPAARRRGSTRCWSPAACSPSASAGCRGPDPAMLADWIATQTVKPTYAIGRLR